MDKFAHLKMNVSGEEQNTLFAQMKQAVLSYCDNPEQFFLHTLDQLEELSELQKSLQVMASSLPPLKNIVNGARCISLYSLDNKWYRTKIVDEKLKFIDFGYTDLVANSSDLKQMKGFAKKAPLCTPCALPIKPIGTPGWVYTANTIFNESSKKMLRFEYLSYGDEHDPERRCLINLYIDGINVAEKLIQEGLARPRELLLCGEKCRVTQVYNPTEFYIQYEKDANALELIKTHLQGKNLPRVEKYEQTETVAALSPEEDQLFYRAKILTEVPGVGVKVFLIDYGKTIVSTECRKISMRIANIPPLSKKCSLELPKGYAFWGEVAQRMFVEMSDCGKTIFTVKRRQLTEKCAIVELRLGGHNIAYDLAPFCVPCVKADARIFEKDNSTIIAPNTVHKNDSGNHYLNSPKNMSPPILLSASDHQTEVVYVCKISHWNSLDEIFIQFENDAVFINAISDILNTLSETLTIPTVGQICAAFSKNDCRFYRARILEVLPPRRGTLGIEYSVFFIDYGNTGISNNLRELTEDLKQLKPLCTRSRWVNSYFYGHSLKLANKCFEEYLVACKGTMKVRILDNKSDPVVVTLYDATKKQELITTIDKGLGILAEREITVVVPSTKMKGASFCTISEITSPQDFYIQLRANRGNLERIAKMLSNKKPLQWPLVRNVTVGVFCCVYVDRYARYFRGRVQSVLGPDEGFDVELVDYGETVKAFELRELPHELYVPPQAFKCRLNVVSCTETDLYLGGIYRIVEHTFDDVNSVYIVHLQLAPTKNVNAPKVEPKFGDKMARLASPVNETPLAENQLKLEPCQITRFNSPDSFYILLERDTATLQIVNGLLNKSELEPLKTLPKVGTNCLALSKRDNSYYRAIIIEVLRKSQYEVLFIDYGYRDKTDQLRELPAFVMNTEIFCKHCSLNVRSPISNESCEKLTTFMSSHVDTTFHVSFVDETTSPIICDLFYNNQNLANELM